MANHFNVVLERHTILSIRGAQDGKFYVIFRYTVLLGQRWALEASSGFKFTVSLHTSVTSRKLLNLCLALSLR